MCVIHMYIYIYIHAYITYTYMNIYLHKDISLLYNKGPVCPWHAMTKYVWGGDVSSV